jgi:DNA-directed RNA polymerase specialized sigma subunit
MRHQADPYLYANPLVEPMSLDALAVSGVDGKPITFRDTAPNAEEQLALSQAEAAVHNFIEMLNARDQNLIARIFWDGQRQADVARAFAVSDVAISRRLNRIVARGRVALAKLRDGPLFG